LINRRNFAQWNAQKSAQHLDGALSAVFYHNFPIVLSIKQLHILSEE